jgi:hypothetical protein
MTAYGTNRTSRGCLMASVGRGRPEEAVKSRTRAIDPEHTFLVGNGRVRAEWQKESLK